RAIAEFVTGQSFGAPLSTIPSRKALCSSTGGTLVTAGAPEWNGWGVNTSNTRFQNAAMAGLGAAEVPRLKLKWAFGFPGDLQANAQATIAGGRVFVGSAGGKVYALNAATGCV